jgi:hypothetical protein
MFNTEELTLLSEWMKISDKQVQLLKDIVIKRFNDLDIILENDIKMNVIKIGEWYQLVIISDKEFSVDITKTGDLKTIRESISVDIKEIKEKCHLQKFPMKLNCGTIMYNEKGEFLLNDEILTIKHLYDEPSISYVPFCVSDRNKDKDGNYISNEQYILLPEYNYDSCVAFIVNRYAWGMNTNVAILDPISKTIYCWKSDNYDYPTGIALRKCKGEVEMYLSNDNVTRKVLYNDQNSTSLYSFENIYSDSNWYDLNVEEDMNLLKKYITYSNTNLEFTRLSDKLELLDEYMNNDDYNNYINTAKDLECFLNDGYIYDLACCHSILNNCDLAMKYLLRVKTIPYDHVYNDKELCNLHERLDFKEWLKDYK